MTDRQDRLDAEASADDEAPTESASPAVEPAAAEPATDEPTPAAVADSIAPSPAASVADQAPVEAAASPAQPPRRARRQQPAPSAPAPLSPYAIIVTGGKQYRVSVGDSLAVERLPAEAGTDLTIDRVLMLGGGGAPRIGTPTVAGAAVTARVEDHYRGDKLVVFKYKAKKRYRRRIGHRQSLTRLTITGISG